MKKSYNEIINFLQGQLTILNLGTAGDKDLDTRINKAITIIGIDAVAPTKSNLTKYFRSISIKSMVGGRKGKRIFHKRKWPDCSSFLDIKSELPRTYGIEEMTISIEDVEVECELIKDILGQHKVEKVELVKLDLEGLDFEILKSAPEIFSKALIITTELRFQPFFVGEPTLYEVSSYLESMGFELIKLRPEVWKLKTKNSGDMLDGRLVFADCIFLLSSHKIKEVFKDQAGVEFLKQIILAKEVCGLHNYAQYLYENFVLDMPERLKKEIDKFMVPALTFYALLYKFIKIVSYLPFASSCIYFIRNWLLKIIKILTFHKRLRHIVFPIDKM